jgi:hypothetical protein
MKCLHRFIYISEYAANIFLNITNVLLFVMEMRCVFRGYTLRRLLTHRYNFYFLAYFLYFEKNSVGL